ncbi:nestin [Lampris incognitus]|uniref:nestin n=1 Tax=Lampris incognitus TaxID=2546036 RepID=UPI0024B5B943|nr:nestin [Lampris incognitus]
MEIRSMRPSFHHLSEERHQMLNLNRRLETYLGRVKLLEKENEALCGEIQSLSACRQGAASSRKGLENELRQARMEVKAAWGEKDHVEVEVACLMEELRALGLLRQREVAAKTEVKAKLEESRREMEEEQRAQIWLREKVTQLEGEVQLLILSHQEEVAHAGATLSWSRSTVTPTTSQMPNLLQLGQEYSRMASRAWQEATRVHQGQVARLEESLSQARACLARVGQEKNESHLKLQTLEKELISARETRDHLDKNLINQRDRNSQEIQQLQEQLEGLEVEREELGQQIDALLMENRSLLELKMSLGLEVATYRALLDNESFRCDVSPMDKFRSTSITDAVSSPQGFKESYRAQLSTTHLTTPLSSIRGVNSRPKLVIKNTTPIWNQKLPTVTKVSQKAKDDLTETDTVEITKSAALETPYPKVLQNGTVEQFRPQEVHEEVNYAEPLSPPNEQVTPVESMDGSHIKETTMEVDEGEEDLSTSHAGSQEQEQEQDQVLESTVSYQVESAVPLTKDVTGFSDEHGEMVLFDVSAEKEELCKPCAKFDPWAEKELTPSLHIKQAETSDSETQAVLEPTFEPGTSSPASECEPEESVFNQLANFSQQENISNTEATATSQQEEDSMAGTNEEEFEDKLYPDGEEMDTWDSVIERRVDMEKDKKVDEIKPQHIEPEEDISAGEQEAKEHERNRDVTSVTQYDDSNLTSSLTDTTLRKDGQPEKAFPNQQHVSLSNKEDEDNDEEDSQNVSVSWRTELESDSYAQDNTLADTRPLIRYKSDEMDANAQAFVDVSNSSEGEEDHKVGEIGSGNWSESKSKRSGTMEDLWEEAGGEILDDEYDLDYTHTADLDASHGRAPGLQSPLADGKLVEVEMNRKVMDRHSNEKTEEHTKWEEIKDVDYNEELDMVDRLVEQELESLSTATYSACFGLQQTGEREHLLNLLVETDKEMTEQEFGKTKREDMFYSEEQEVAVNNNLPSSTSIQTTFEQPHFSIPLEEIPHTDLLAQEEVQHEEKKTFEGMDNREEDYEHNHNLSMLTNTDLTEDRSICSDLSSSRPGSQINVNNSDAEESNSSVDESPNVSRCSQLTAHVIEDQDDMMHVAFSDKGQKAVSVEGPSSTPQHSVEGAADSQASLDALQTVKWESQSTDLETRGPMSGDQMCSDAAERPFHGEHSIHKTHEGSPEVSPDSILTKADIFQVKDSSESLKTNCEDRSPHDVFSSVNEDFWGSTQLTGATYQPDDPYNDAAERANQNLTSGENLVFGKLGKQFAANGKSRKAFDSSKAVVCEEKLVATEEEQRSDVKELVHSEGSEDEGESWSPGEESLQKSNH